MIRSAVDVTASLEAGVHHSQGEGGLATVTTDPTWTGPAWTEPEPEVAAFLDDYDSRGDRAAGLFAGTFLVLDPARAISLDPAALAAALPARRRMFDAAGVGEISRTGARQLRLDAQHVLVSATWRADRAGSVPLELASTLLLRREPDRYEVVVYLNHTDLAAALAG
jgi:hypothetical protein